MKILDKVSELFCLGIRFFIQKKLLDQIRDLSSKCTGFFVQNEKDMWAGAWRCLQKTFSHRRKHTRVSVWCTKTRVFLHFVKMPCVVNTNVIGTRKSRGDQSSGEQSPGWMHVLSRNKASKEGRRRVYKWLWGKLFCPLLPRGANSTSLTCKTPEGGSFPFRKSSANMAAAAEAKPVSVCTNTCSCCRSIPGT